MIYSPDWTSMVNNSDLWWQSIIIYKSTIFNTEQRTAKQQNLRSWHVWVWVPKWLSCGPDNRCGNSLWPWSWHVGHSCSTPWDVVSQLGWGRCYYGIVGLGSGGMRNCPHSWVAASTRIWGGKIESSWGTRCARDQGDCLTSHTHTLASTHCTASRGRTYY